MKSICKGKPTRTGKHPNKNQQEAASTSGHMDGGALQRGPPDSAVAFHRERVPTHSGLAGRRPQNKHPDVSLFLPSDVLWCLPMAKSTWKTGQENPLMQSIKVRFSGTE